MHRRVTPADFAEARAAMQDLAEFGYWSACNAYEICGEKIVAKYKLSALEDHLSPEDVWWFYSPLEDAPDLFLTFARLYKEKNFDEAALTFSHRYGLPASTPVDIEGGETRSRIAEEIDISQFHEEARKAYFILALYEAIINQDTQTAKQFLLERHTVDSIFEQHHRALYLIEELQGANGILHAGLDYVIDAVQSVVQKTCRQRISVAGPRNRTKVPDLSKIKTVWQHDSLLGAMYLQMWWFVVSGNDIARCEHCGRPVSLGRSHPEARKRRRDKRFCNDACRQAHHRSRKKRRDTEQD